MFGDILSDQASMCVGIDRHAAVRVAVELAVDTLGLYEPIHGSAPDIAGQGKANPCAAILSAAMMLRHSLDMTEAAMRIEGAVAQGDRGRRADARSGRKPLDKRDGRRDSRAPMTEALDLAVVIPTFNERKNVPLLVEKLDAALAGLSWEAIFVDDDSPDGTADAARDLAMRDRRVRVIQRIGRRGLSSATIEGMCATAAPLVAVIDGCRPRCAPSFQLRLATCGCTARSTRAGRAQAHPDPARVGSHPRSPRSCPRGRR